MDLADSTATVPAVRRSSVELAGSQIASLGMELVRLGAADPTWIGEIGTPILVVLVPVSDEAIRLALEENPRTPRAGHA
jgi:hypothetical protein